MATITAELIVSLVDQVTAPARALAGTIEGLEAAQRSNTRQLNEARMGMVDAAAGAIALARAIGTPVQIAADFESAMNQVAAVSGATGDQLEALSDLAKDLGRTTQYTASQAADAMNFLAMAGFATNDILEAMPGTLQLAAAAQLDLGQAADIVSNILTGYGQDVESLGHVTDVLVKAFTSANTDLAQLGEALKYAGPVASAAGLSFEEVAAALGLMGNAGIQASMAGTSVRGAISQILNPSAKAQRQMQALGLSFTDAQGRILPLADILDQLEPHVDDAGLFMELFGQRAGPAMAALVAQGAESLRELTGELENSAGTAERVASVQMQGFNGQMRAMQSATEGVQIALGMALIPTLTALAAATLPVLQATTEFIEANETLVLAVVGLTAGIVGLRVATLASAYVMLFMRGAMLSVAIQSLRLVQALLFLLNPLNLVKVAFVALRMALLATGIGALVAGIALAGLWIYNNWEPLGALFRGIGAGFSEAFGPIMPVLQPIGDWLVQAVDWFTNLLGPIDKTSFEMFQIGKALGFMAGTSLSALRDGIAALPELIGAFFASLDGDTAAKKGLALGAALAQAAAQGVGGAAGAIWDAIMHIAPEALSIGLGFVINDLPGILAWLWDAYSQVVTFVAAISLGTVAGLLGWLWGVYRDGVNLVVGMALGAAADLLSWLWEVSRTGFVAGFDFIWPTLPAWVQWFIDLAGGLIQFDLASVFQWPQPPSWLTWLIEGGSNIVGGLFGGGVDGARAAGGSVAGGRTYLVGENGPELFSPDRSGWVHSNADTAGLMSRRSGVTISSLSLGGITITGVQNPTAIVDEVVRLLEERLADGLNGIHADI